MGGNRAAFGMHAMGGNLVAAHGQERARANMQRQRLADHARRIQPRQQGGREMQPGCGGGHRATVLGEDGAVIPAVRIGGTVGPGDIGRQRQMAHIMQELVECRPVRAEAQGHVAPLAARDHPRRDMGRAECQRITRMQAAGVAGQHVPCAIGQDTVQRYADLRVPPHGRQLCGDHRRIIGHQDVARAQAPRQVAHMAVPERPIHRHIQQARAVTRAGRMIGDILWREGEVEIRNQIRHAAPFTESAPYLPARTVTIATKRPATGPMHGDVGQKRPGKPQ